MNTDLQSVFPVLQKLIGDFFENNTQNSPMILGRLLKKSLRKNRHFNNEQRRLLALYGFGIVCFHRRLSAILELNNLEPNFFSEIPLQEHIKYFVFVYMLDQQQTSIVQALELCALQIEELPQKLREFIKARLESSLNQEFQPLFFDASFYNCAAEEMALPDFIWDIFKSSIPDPKNCVAALHRPAPIVFRAQKSLNTREELLKKLTMQPKNVNPSYHFKVELGKLAKHALILTGRHNIYGCKLWQQGAYEVQDQGSQLIAEALGAQNGERILDFCAGYGGKTLALWDRMDNGGELVAHDIRELALEQLRRRSERVHLGHKIRIYSHLQTLIANYGTQEADKFDRILVDAPCSSLGTLRRGPDLKWRISKAEIEAFPKVQLAILQQAAQLLKKGGVLVYATCTINRAENEEVRHLFLEQNKGVFVPNQDENKILDIEATRLLRPDVDFCDAFYICRFKKYMF